jgi:hypothetical protein
MLDYPHHASLKKPNCIFAVETAAPLNEGNATILFATGIYGEASVGTSGQVRTRWTASG